MGDPTRYTSYSDFVFYMFYESDIYIILVYMYAYRELVSISRFILLLYTKTIERIKKTPQSDTPSKHYPPPPPKKKDFKFSF